MDIEAQSPKQVIQLGQVILPPPTRACSHTWLGTRPAQAGRSDAGQPGMERVEGRDYGGQCQDGQGPQWDVVGKRLFMVTTCSSIGRLCRFTSTLCKGSCCVHMQLIQADFTFQFTQEQSAG